MVLGAALPRIIGAFMIVGVWNDGEVRVQRLQLRVGAIACIAQAIIRQRQDFIRREYPCCKFRAAIVPSTAIFLDIVAHV